MYRLIAIDDDPQVLRDLERTLLDPRLRLETATDPVAALELLRDTEFDVVIAACRMPEVDGVRLLTEVRKRHPRTVRLMLIGHADMRGRGAALNDAGIFRFVAKPWGAPELRQAVADAIAQRERVLEAGRALRAAAPAADFSIRRRLTVGELRKLANA